MNVKEITMGIVATIVALVIVVVCAIPIISDSVATEDTFENEGYFRMQKITAEDTTEYTLKWVKATDTFTLNGVEVNIGDHSQYTGSLGVSVAMTDNSVSRYVTNLRIQSWSSGLSASMGFSQTSTEITFSNGVQTITVDKGLESENTRTVNYEVAYFISNDGDYVMKKPTQTAYVLADSELFAVGRTDIDTSGEPTPSTLKMTGDASDVEFSIFNGATTAVFSDINITKTETPMYVGLYDLEKVTAIATYDSTDTDITYSYFVVPYEVTAERSQPLDTSIATILTVIPVMMILAVLIGAVTMFIKTRRD